MPLFVHFALKKTLRFCVSAFHSIFRNPFLIDYKSECPHFAQLLVGAGLACPNASADVSTDVFRQVIPTPHGLYLQKLFYRHGRSTCRHHQHRAVYSFVIQIYADDCIGTHCLSLFLHFTESRIFSFT